MQRTLLVLLTVLLFAATTTAQNSVSCKSYPDGAGTTTVCDRQVGQHHTYTEAYRSDSFASTEQISKKVYDRIMHDIAERERLKRAEDDAKLRKELEQSDLEICRQNPKWVDRCAELLKKYEPGPDRSEPIAPDIK